MPLVLRQTAVEDGDRLIGDAYVHGYMEGEAVSQDPTSFRLVIEVSEQDCSAKTWRIWMWSTLSCLVRIEKEGSAHF